MTEIVLFFLYLVRSYVELDGWIDGWMDRWIDRQSRFSHLNVFKELRIPFLLIMMLMRYGPSFIACISGKVLLSLPNNGALLRSSTGSRPPQRMANCGSCPVPQGQACEMPAELKPWLRSTLADTSTPFQPQAAKKLPQAC